MEQRSTYSISDPALLQYFMTGRPFLDGITVSEASALGLSSVWRAVSVIAGTLATLPLRSLREVDGRREQVSTWLDNPGGTGPEAPTPFQWKETSLAHAAVHGNTYFAHIYNGAGALTGLSPIHPCAVTPRWQKDATGKLTGLKEFTVSLDDGTTRIFDSTTMTQVMGLSLDGLCGLSPVSVARISLGTAIAGDKAAAKQFTSGALIAGLITPEDDVTEAEARDIKEGITAKVSGVDNAGEIAVINRKLKFTPWTMSNEDAQFLESRQFSVEEVARWYGIPLHLMMRSGAVSNWGTGVEEQNVALGRTVLAPWAQRFDEKLSQLLPRGTWAEFDFAGLERANPEDEITLLLAQVAGGLLTVDEARAIRNLPPLPKATTPPEVPGDSQTV